ncbi:MAG TPA: histone-like nucleoid-structuring protein Lsr2 [Pseudonocardiaceae bacterium]|nr:histone-like nucleoid-structuring protein Lsr2 [Pseudonocardiaceae bacterium]
MELLIARNPDAESRLPYLLRVPLGDGLVFRARDTWPRTTAVYLHPVWPDEWPEAPEIVERVPVRSCVRRGAAIDLVLDRGREYRSQIVYTMARGREMVFWQSPRTRKQARPNVTTPTARAAGLPDLSIVVDSHERYAYRFADKPVTITRKALTAGDYGLERGGRLVASVERKSLADLVTSLTTGKLKFAIAELATLPRAALVVEDRYSQIFNLTQTRPAVVADGLAELQVRWPNVPVVFCETRKLAEEWTYRYLAAAQIWYDQEQAAGPIDPDDKPAPAAPKTPSTTEIRAWARDQGIAVADRGRLRPEVVAAWHQAHPRHKANETD